MKTSAKNNTYTLITRKAASILVIFMMLLSCSMTPIGGVLGTTDTAYAKTIGSKNRQACDTCNNINNPSYIPTYKDYSSTKAGTQPSTGSDDSTWAGLSYSSDGYATSESSYQDVLGDRTVLRGGNAKSRQDNYLDDDPDDFASVLPYGTVYLDTNKISIGANTGRSAVAKGRFSIDIQDTDFVWMSLDPSLGGVSLEDKNGNTPTLFVGENAGTDKNLQNAIAYKGGLKAYLSKINGAENSAYTTSKTNGDYEYLNTPATDDGYQNIIDAQTKGLSYLYRITYYDAVTLPDGTIGDLVLTVNKVVMESSIDIDEDVPIGIQSGKLIGVNISTTDVNGNRYIPATVTLNSVKDAPKDIQVAVGAQIDYDLEVKDKEGNSVDGVISYSVNDLDVIQSQDLWGRPLGVDAANRYMFAEGLTINSGALSYAVTPSYDHANADTTATGWLPISYIDPTVTTPLNIERVSDGSNANGVRFSCSSETKRRDLYGTFDFTRRNDANDTIWPIPIVRNIASQYPGQTQYNRNKEAADILGLVWNSSTDRPSRKDIIDKTKTYNANRNDKNSFDSGFAVLIDSKKTSMTWSGASTGMMGTTLFDSSLFTRVEQSHGTGGGIYLEGYDVSNNCAVIRNEGVVTMGKNVDVTVTAVPEDGYRVQRILVGGANLSSPVEYVIIYDSNGNATGINKDGTVTNLSSGKATIDGIEFEVNSDGSVDVTLQDIDAAKHVHADFTTDYYFTKVWKKPTGSSVSVPNQLKIKATPFVFEMTKVTVDGTEYTISEQGTKYTANGTTYALTTNYAVTLANNKTYRLEGNQLVHYDGGYPGGTADEEWTIEHTITSDPTKAKEFTVDKTDTSNVTVETDSDGNEVWKIKYPAEGASLTNSGAWPALPIETYDGSEHNYNHVERYYWFVGEEAPAGWAMLDYDNSKALAPGWATASDATGTFWKEQSEVYRDATRELIRAQEDNDHAFMSVFNSTNAPSGAPGGASWGGVIENGPAVVLKAEKTWIDFSNDFKTRQDIWLHLDAKLKVWDASANDGAGGYVEKTLKDYLPPQKLASSENTDENNDLDGTQISKIWGDMTTYATGDDTKVIIASAKDLPYKDASNNEIAYDTRDERGGFVGSNGITYYVNTLPAYDASGAQIEWSVRETMDKDGNEAVAKDDETSGLIGYKSDKDEDAWSRVKTNMSTTTLDSVDVTTYTGKFKNTLQTTDFTMTKIWKDNDSGRTHTVADDAEKLKAAYTLKESDETISDGTNLKLQPSTAAAYTVASGSTAASGTLEIKSGTSGSDTTTVFTWHDIPKYVGGDEGVHKAVYSVTEIQLSGYNAPTYSGDDKALNEGTITNEVTPPTGTPKETYGAKNTPQTTDGKSLFSVTTTSTTDGSINTIDKVELLDANGNPATEVTVEGGKYTIDSATGKITFTPDTDFVGDPPAVTVRGTDKNGLSTTTTYTPHVVDNEKSVKRTITYEYEDGTPVKDSNGDPKTVVQETIFVGTVDPDTGVVTYTGVKDPVTGTVTDMTDPQTTFPQVDSESIEGYTVDKENVSSKTVTPSDTDSTEKVIYSPKGISATPDETYGLPGQPQTGTVSFTMETETLPDGTPNKVTPKLIDPKTGESCDSVTIPGQGTYTLNSDGTITFTPEDGFVGNPDPVTVEGTDGNGKKARTTYTPHVVNPEQTGTASRTIHYKYLSETGDEVTADITQTVTLYKHAKSVDPKTGEVLEWDDWEPATFPAVKNPDDKVDGKVWFTDDSADAQTVTEPGDVADVYVIYEKIPYKVTYLDGDQGKSDGKGNQSGEDYGSSVSGGNNVTPKKGYHFTGKYKYVITDHNGNIIKSGETSDPTELEVIGNIEFTPIYEPNKYTIKYDANGGSGTMSSQNFTGADSSANSKKNEFTRKGYVFNGFKVKDKNGNYLKDKNGKDLVFKNQSDFIEYLHVQGDGGELTLEAQWRKLPTVTYVDPATGRIIQKTTPFIDENTEPNAPADPTRKGYKFTGWKRIVEYDDEGNIVSVRYEAQWESVSDDSGSEKESKTGTVDTGDEAVNIGILIAILIASIAASFVIIMRRKKDSV